MTDKPTVLFGCIHNAGRSQMVVGWLTHQDEDNMHDEIRTRIDTLLTEIL